MVKIVKCLSHGFLKFLSEKGFKPLSPLSSQRNQLDLALCAHLAVRFVVHQDTWIDFEKALVLPELVLARIGVILYA